MGPGISRPASSDMMHSSSGSLPQRNDPAEPAPADAAAPGMVPSLVQPALPEVKLQPAQEPAPEPDNSAPSTENVSVLQARLAESLVGQKPPCPSPRVYFANVLKCLIALSNGRRAGRSGIGVRI